mgnify:CR=1 FL=1
MERRVASSIIHAVMVMTVVCVAVGAEAVTGVAMDLGNGITANIHTPEEITEQWMTQAKDGTVLVHPSGGRVELTSSGEGLHPFTPSEVVAALASMRGLSAPVEVDVFILPAFPRETMSSFARRGAIFLAPGTGPVDAATIAYITTHEMGHVLTWAFVDGQPGRWDAYLALRGLDRDALDPANVHAERAREILAEDIRFLFGGPLANVSHSIENSRLATPDRVDGLDILLMGFFAGRGPSVEIAASTAFPNPCNPMTTIEMVVPDGLFVDPARTTLRIFDIRGSLVKTLRGARQANDRLSVAWNGTDTSERVVSSGRYLYIIEAGELKSKGTVTLVR